MGYYFSVEEDEAHRQGHNDYGYRTDYERDKYAYEGVDKAYWDGYKDEQRAEQLRDEERQREDEERRQEQRRENEREIRRQQEEEYYFD